MKNLFKQKFTRIKNIAVKRFETDYHFNAISYLVLGLFFCLGMVVHNLQGLPLEHESLLMPAGATIIAGAILIVFPLWIVMIQTQIVLWVALISTLGPEMIPFLAVLSAGLVLASCFQLIQHWDKVVILRFGRFRCVRGPGLFLILPFVDRIADFVDTRIRATDFSAEKTLTRDTVPVHVDALTFWMIWDAKRAVLEVEDFMQAVVLSAQTALRDAIGKYNLSELLSERDRLGKEIQQILDAKTNPWGITILSIEITDILIPSELEDVMSRQAQAERESQSRITLGNAEIEVAKKFKEAAESYQDNPTALHLRAMNIVYDGLKKGGSLMLLPSSALDSMNLGTVMGASAIQQIRKQEEKQDD